MLKLSDFFISPDLISDSGFSTLDQASSASPNSLCYCQSLHFLNIIKNNNNITCIICNDNLLPAIRELKYGLAVSNDPRRKFFEIYTKLNAANKLYKFHDCGIGKNVKIHPSANVSRHTLIGDNVTIGANSFIADNTRIDDHVFIAQNTVIGADGLLTIRLENERKMFVSHAGGVHIKNGCQILAGAVIARSLFQEPTTVGENSQIGIMANVGHGVVLGADCVISGNSVVAGRTRLGKSVWVGASSVISQGLDVGDYVQIKTGSIVVSNLSPNSVVSGNFAVNHRVNVESYLRRKTS